MALSSPICIISVLCYTHSRSPLSRTLSLSLSLSRPRSVPQLQCDVKCALVTFAAVLFSSFKPSECVKMGSVSDALICKKKKKYLCFRYKQWKFSLSLRILYLGVRLFHILNFSVFVEFPVFISLSPTALGLRSVSACFSLFFLVFYEKTNCLFIRVRHR